MKGVKAGKTTLTAKVKIGKKTYKTTCKVTIKKAKKPMSPITTPLTKPLITPVSPTPTPTATVTPTPVPFPVNKTVNLELYSVDKKKVEVTEQKWGIYNSKEEKVYEVKTDISDASIRCKLLPGEYTIKPELLSKADYQGKFTVNNEDNQTIQVSTNLALVYGKVVIPNSAVNVNNGSASYYMKCPNGSSSFSQVSINPITGEYQLICQPAKYEIGYLSINLFKEEFEVKEAPTHDKECNINIDVPLYRVQGKITDIEGNPVKTDELTFSGEKYSELYFSTDTDGTYDVYLPAETYYVGVYCANIFDLDDGFVVDKDCKDVNYMISRHQVNVELKTNNLINNVCMGIYPDNGEEITSSSEPVAEPYIRDNKETAYLNKGNYVLMWDDTKLKEFTVDGKTNLQVDIDTCRLLIDVLNNGSPLGEEIEEVSLGANYQYCTNVYDRLDFVVPKGIKTRLLFRLDGVNAWRTFDIVVGQDDIQKQEIDVKSCKVSISCTDSEGKPVNSQFFLIYSMSESSVVGSVFSNIEGKLTAYIPAGKYKIIANKTTYEKDFTIEDGQKTMSLNIKLP